MKKVYKIIVFFILLTSIHSVHAQDKETLAIHRNKKGKISYVRFKENGSRKITNAESQIKSLLNAGKNDEFKLKSEVVDKFGVIHRKYQQYFQGIKVEGAEFMIHSKNGAIIIMNGDFQEPALTSIQPTVTEKNALTNALQFVNAKRYKWEDKAQEELLKKNLKNPEATYYPKGIVVITNDFLLGGDNLRLAWQFSISSILPYNEQLIYVDAFTGKVIRTTPLLLDTNTPLTAQTKYSGTVSITGDSFSGGYNLTENRNGVPIGTYNGHNTYNYTNASDFTNTNTSFTSSNWTNFSQDQQALDAHWGMEKVLDYWSTVHSRNSLDGNGLYLTSYVHAGSNWNNAHWANTQNGQYMEFGDGDGYSFNPLTSLDICAHETGHGINTYTAGLAAGNQESAALNEGFSDIWGACIEYWADPTKQRWLIAEEVVANPSKTCLRNLQDPKSSTTLEGQHPDTYLGTFWDTGGEPHNNSTVLSHWFYLISEGGSGTNDNNNNFSVNAIGIGDAQVIAYQTELLLSANSNYSDARYYSIQAAINTFGAGSCQEIAVTNAWYAVGVGSQYVFPTLSISGQGLICTSEVYTLNNLPSGSSVIWDITPGSIATVSPNGSSATFYKSGDGPATITASATNSCGVPIASAEKSVNVGNIVSGTYYVTSNYYTGSGSLAGSGGSVFTRSNQTVLFNGMLDQNIGLSNISWSVSGSYSLFYPNGSNFSLYMTTPSNAYSSNNATVTLSATGQCSTFNKAYNFQVVSTGSGSGYLIAASPNPATNDININIEEVEDTTLVSQKEQNIGLANGNSRGKTKIYLLEFYTNRLVKQWNYDEMKTKNYHLNITGIKAGYYVLRMERDSKVTNTKVIVR